MREALLRAQRSIFVVQEVALVSFAYIVGEYLGKTFGALQRWRFEQRSHALTGYRVGFYLFVLSVKDSGVSAPFECIACECIARGPQQDLFDQIVCCRGETLMCIDAEECTAEYRNTTLWIRIFFMLAKYF